jgi:hypothetical protein
LPSPLRLTHRINDAVELAYGGTTLFRYVYMPDTAPKESPKPYFHPVQTLAGNLITNFRPHDHVWHKGLAMTLTSVSGENFWGGPTYVHGSGYVQQENNGRQEHRAWREMSCDDRAALTETLAWVSQAGETMLSEERQIAVPEIDAADGWYQLDFITRLHNVTGRTLMLGSPTTAGRPLAGYGSLFWRGPRSFLNGTILAGDLSGPEVMGQRAPWLAFIGRHDGSGDASTLLFLDHPENPRYPTQWFVRNESYAGASFAFVFDEEYALEPGAELALHYRVVIADGAWSRERIEGCVASGAG